MQSTGSFCFPSGTVCVCLSMFVMLYIPISHLMNAFTTHIQISTQICTHFIFGRISITKSRLEIFSEIFKYYIQQTLLCLTAFFSRSLWAHISLWHSVNKLISNAFRAAATKKKPERMRCECAHTVTTIAITAAATTAVKTTASIVWLWSTA